MPSPPFKVDAVNQPFAIDAGGTNVTFVAPNGALYMAGFVALTETMLVYKSLDNGVTWTAQDTANQPNGAAGDTWFVENTALAGSVLCIVSTSDVGTLFVILYTFDTATDTWVLGTGAGVTTSNVIIADSLFTTFPYLQQYNTVPCLGRADGTVVIGGIYYFTLGPVTPHYVWYRPYYFIFDTNSGGFTSWTLCGYTDTTNPVSCAIVRIVQGDGMVHFILETWDHNYNNFVDLPGTYNQLNQQPLSDADSLGTMETILQIGLSTQPGPSGEPNSGVSTTVQMRFHAYGDGTKVVLAWANSLSSPWDQIAILEATSATSMTWTETDVTIATPDPFSTEGYQIASLIGPTTSYVFLTGEGILESWVGGGGTWGSSVTQGSWSAFALTPVWVATASTWGIGADASDDELVFWINLGTTRKNNYISNGPRLMTLGPYIA